MKSYWEEAIDELSPPKRTPVKVPEAAAIRAAQANPPVSYSFIFGGSSKDKIYSFPEQKKWFEKAGFGMYFVNENDELEAKIDWFMASCCLSGLVLMGLVTMFIIKGLIG